MVISLKYNTSIFAIVIFKLVFWKSRGMADAQNIAPVSKNASVLLWLTFLINRVDYVVLVATVL